MAFFNAANGKGKATWDLAAADDPADWSPSFDFLRPLDNSLRCELCFDIFTAPVALKECSHTFCSQCIRKSINQTGSGSQQCPKCRAKGVHDSSLQPQQALEAAAVAWRKARVGLMTKQEEEQSREEEQSADDAEPVEPEAGPSSRGTKRKAPTQRAAAGADDDSDGSFVISSSPIRESRSTQRAAKQRSREGAEDSPVVIDADSDDDDFIDEPARPRDSPQKRAKQNGNKESKEADYRKMNVDEVTTCPICSHEFTLRALDKHLEKKPGCKPGDPEPPASERGIVVKAPAGKGSGWFSKAGGSGGGGANQRAQSGPSSAASPAGGRSLNKKLLRQNYHLLKEKELVKLLQDADLPTTGGRERLTERHRQWVNLHNANLDASEKQRKSAYLLKRDLAEWDRGQDAAEKIKAKGGLVPAAKAKSWKEKHADEFATLTEEARRSNEKNKLAHAKLPPQLEKEREAEQQAEAAGPSRAANGDANGAKANGNAEESQDYFAQLDDGEEGAEDALMGLP